MGESETLRLPTRYYELCEQIRMGETRFCVAEHSAGSDGESISAEPAHPFNERLIQLIWHEQLMDSAAMKTTDGFPVTVFDPGRWNREAGPDFKDADIQIGTRRFRGDIEIHIRRQDWYAHEHDTDFEYNNVVLHVEYYPSDQPNIVLQNGENVPSLVLENILFPDLDSIRNTYQDDSLLLDGEDLPDAAGCVAKVSMLSESAVEEFFRVAARERLESRIDKFAQRRKTESHLDEVLYQALLMAMGSKSGKTLYYLLSKRVPINELRIFVRNSLTPADAYESIFLHVAGLLDTESIGEATDDMFDGNADSPADDDSTMQWKEAMYREWQEYKVLYSDRMIPATRRWFSGIRPVNYPTRRLAGIARILRNIPKEATLTDYFYHAVRQSAARSPKTAKDFKREIAALADLIMPGDICYWSNRFTVGGKRINIINKLIGEDRALSVLFNALIPFLLMRSREMKDSATEKYLLRLHDHFPALQSNVVTKYMRTRLFGNNPTPSGLTFRPEWQNQALFQVFYTCCTNPDLTCAECVFCR